MAFAHFQGVNIPIMAEFQLQGDDAELSSCELVQTAPLTTGGIEGESVTEENQRRTKLRL